MSFPLPCLQRKNEKDFEIGELLGRGNFTSVYHCLEIETGVTMAVKIIDRYRCERLKKTPDVTMEKHCLRRLNHPNIVKMYGFFTDTCSVYMVLEECSGGELWETVKTVGLPDKLARHYIPQIINAMDYMRQANIVHRDLKAENVMLTGTGTIKLIDFGTAKDLWNPQIKGSGNASRRKVFEHYVGTPQFMAAEIIENRFSDFRSDTWAFGCFMFQVLVGAPPFHGASEYLVFLRIMDMDLQFPPGINPLAKDLIQKIVVKDPDARLGCVDVDLWRRHPYFEDVEHEGTHSRPQPLLSLADACLRKAGQRIKAVKKMMAVRRKELEESLRPELLAQLDRMVLVQKWLDDSMPQEKDDEDDDK
jgi:3-phosphoinositide dependent protein kinase-1